LTWTKDGWELNEPKTKRGKRTIPVPPETVETLRAWQAAQAEERMKAGETWKGEARPRDGFAFTAPLGGPIERRNAVNRGFKPIMNRYRKAQVKARELAEKGVELEDIVKELDRSEAIVRRWIAADRVVPERIRMCDLRHTCATLMLVAGVNPKVVSERLGHASVVLTLDTYSHVLPNMQGDATDKLGALIYDRSGA
jgi:integrase